MSALLPARLILDRVPTPVGDLLIVTDEDGLLRAANFHDFEARLAKSLRILYRKAALDTGTAPASTKSRLRKYFDGDIDALSQIEWTTAGTDFQRKYWTLLAKVPAGTTTTYGELACKLKAPLASRAVGLANGSNPVSVVVPCHRVIGSTGALTGYGGGLHRKEWLLRHEGVPLDD